MMKAQLQAAYLDYLNNYLTIAHFASDYDLSERQARKLIDLGQSVHASITDA